MTTSISIQAINDYLIAHPGKVTEAIEAPVSPSIGERWKVIDPVTGKLSCNRVFIPFRDYLEMMEGLDQDLIQKVPVKDL